MPTAHNPLPHTLSQPLSKPDSAPDSTQTSMPRRRLLVAGAALASPLAITGCAGPAVGDYAAERPLLDLRRYFDGEIAAHGIFVDRSGKVVRRFSVAMMCRWNGAKDQEEGELDERFTYSDGTLERRVWRLRHLGAGRYSGRADDVVGEATGQTAGNSFRWAYTLRLPVDGRTWEVQFDDWMHLVDDRVMLNRATMSKFGIRLGEVQLAFTRTTPQRVATTPQRVATTQQRAAAA